MVKLYFLLTLILFAGDSVFAQGELTPADAPAPTMKSLDQVEARVIVNAANTPGDETNTFIISSRARITSQGISPESRISTGLAFRQMT